MKFNKIGQLGLVGAASLVLAGALSACSTLTTDFVFVTSAKAAGTNNYGEVDVFEVNSMSGAMRQIPTSPFPSGGRNPVAEAVSRDNQNLYVVNRDDNSVVQMVIGSDGKLYPTFTANTPGIFPMGIVAGTGFVYVLDTYAPLATCSDAAPCSGSIGVLPIMAAHGNVQAGSLGTAVTNGNLSYWSLSLSGAKAADVIKPTAITLTANGSYLYAVGYDTTSGGGWLFGFATSSTGALTPLSGFPMAVGVQPSAVVADATSSHLYVTDSTGNVVYGYAINSGQVSALSGSPYATGRGPSSIAIDPAAGFAYVTNNLDSTVTLYTSNNGVLSKQSSYATGVQPVAVGIDPSKNHFVYTVNYLSSSVSSFEINLTDGTLVNSMGSPSASHALPTAVAAIPHGSTTTSSK